MREEELTKTAACYQFDVELEPYLEGEVKPHVERHAHECPRCGAILDDMRRIMTLCRRLPDAEPPSALWHNLRAALVDEGIIHAPAGFWRRWFGEIRLAPAPVPLAALGMIAILAAALTAPPTPSGSGAPAWPAGLTTASIMSVPEVNPYEDLSRTIQQLENNYEARAPYLDPSVKEIYARSLGSLNNSIRECLDSVHREPANGLAREYLYAAYTQKAELLAAALDFEAQ